MADEPRRSLWTDAHDEAVLEELRRIIALVVQHIDRYGYPPSAADLARQLELRRV